MKRKKKREPNMWMIKIGENIRRCIKDAEPKLTQKVVAERAGITASQLSRIVNGEEADIMASTLNGIVNAIGCSADEILGKKEMTIQQALAVLNKYKNTLGEGGKQ